MSDAILCGPMPAASEGEAWSPTMLLRWRYKSLTGSPTLQQKWIGSRGGEQWIDIHRVFEPESEKEQGA